MKFVLEKLRIKVLNGYPSIIKILFFCFIFGVLSLGRAFSVLHIDIANVPLFITEAMIFISLPFIVANRKSLLKLPKNLLAPLILFFLFGLFYFAYGLLSGNLFVLRDIVLFGYILFLPLTYIILPQVNRLKLFLPFILLCNLVALIIGALFVFDYYFMYHILTLRYIKSLSLGLCCGIATAFFISFFYYTRNRLFKALSLFFTSSSLFLLILFNVRTLWVAYIGLWIFYFLIFKRRLIKFVFALLPYLLIIACIVFSLAHNSNELIQRKESIMSKARSFGLIHKIGALDNLRRSSVLSGQQYEEYECVGNASWRLGIWKQAVMFGSESILIGRGFGVYPKYHALDNPRATFDNPTGIGLNSGVIPPHNHLITVFYKMGLLGLILFLFINFYIFIHGLKYIGKCRADFTRYFLIGSLGAYVFWHVMALFFDLIDSPPSSVLLWIISGAILAIIEMDKKEKAVEY